MTALADDETTIALLGKMGSAAKELGLADKMAATLMGAKRKAQ